MLKEELAEVDVLGLARVVTVTSGSEVICMDCSSKCCLSRASLDLQNLTEKDLHTEHLLGCSSPLGRREL